MAQLFAFYMPSIINAIHIQKLTEIILPSAQNIVGTCRQITILKYQVSSRLVTHPKCIYASTPPAFLILFLTIFNLLILSDIPSFFFLKVLLVSHLTLLTLFHTLGFYFVATAFGPASFEITILSTVHQIMAYVAQHGDLRLPWMKLLIFSNNFLVLVAIIQVSQSSKCFLKF